MEGAASAQIPDRVAGAWQAAQEFGRRREVRIAVLALAMLLAGASYIRFMHDIYKGDSWIYWSAVHSPNVYVTAQGSAPDGYLYSPAFIQILWPILSLPWEVFYGIWLAVGTVAVLWMARPWLSLLLFPPVFITFGIALLAIPRHSFASVNVTLFYGLAVAASFRWPATWSLLLLTKVTPGLGVLWFAVRREWRNLAIALGATAAIVAVSFAIAPNLWFDWITVLKNNSSYPEPSFAYHILPLLPRLVIAAVVVVVAARYDARWAMPIAALIAMPYIWDTSLMVLLGIVPLLRNDGWTRPKRTPRADSNERAATVPLPA
jgi:hypothetical protein